MAATADARLEKGWFDEFLPVLFMGGIAFLMGFFYLLNRQDRENLSLHAYASRVLASSTSIFSAALLFQATSQAIDALLLEGLSQQFEFALAVAQATVWFAVLQVALFALSFVPRAEPALMPLERVERKLKCFGTTAGHVFGFAYIHACSIAQQSLLLADLEDPGHWPRTLFATVATWLPLALLGFVLFLLRQHIKWFGEAVDEVEELWNEVSDSTEDDAVGLAVSFLLVQLFRLHVGGAVPSVDFGEEWSVGQHSRSQAIAMFCIGLCFLVLLLVTGGSAAEGRYQPQLRRVYGLTFAWSSLCGADWFFSLTAGGLAKEMLLALLAVIVAFIITMAMAATVDGPDNPKVQPLVLCLGVLIGLPCEQVFERAMDGVVVRIPFLLPSLAKLLLAVVVICILGFVLFRHILTQFVAQDRHRKEALLLLPRLSKQKVEPLLPKRTDLVALAPGDEALHLEKEKLQRRLLDLQSRAAHMNDEATRNAALKRRNKELEATIESLYRELQSLQRLAHQLAASV